MCTLDNDFSSVRSVVNTPFHIRKSILIENRCGTTWSWSINDSPSWHFNSALSIEVVVLKLKSHIHLIRSSFPLGLASQVSLPVQTQIFCTGYGIHIISHKKLLELDYVQFELRMWTFGFCANIWLSNMCYLLVMLVFKSGCLFLLVGQA